jgi:chlorobactene glucosyltransferase
VTRVKGNDETNAAVDAAMIAAAVALLWALVVATLIARAVRQYGAYEVVQPAPLLGAAPMIDIVVPARNEADAIGDCLGGLVAQDYPASCVAITVVDDGSTDGTAAIARGMGGAAVPLAVIEAGPLPAGWTGKAHACWQGAAQGRGEWLCFIDADTIPTPALLRSAITAARQRCLDFLSLEPRQVLVTVWERLIIPAGLCALGFAGDLRRTGNPDDPSAAANGQFLLLRRAAYERAGGHRAVRGAFSEDSALAARVKAGGGRIAVMGAAPLIGVRMYRSLPQLWEGLVRSVTDTFGGVGPTAVIALAGLVIAWSALAIPAALAVRFAAAPAPLAGAALAVALAASLAWLGVHIAAARYFAIPLAYGLLFPVAYTLAAVLAFAGIRARRQGRVAWKGRSYRTAADRGG